MKRLTPRTVALIVGAGITILTDLLVFLLFLFSEEEFSSWGLFLVLPLILFPIGYLLLKWLIVKFIHERVRVIYKTIHDQKMTPGQEVQVKGDQDTIGRVEDEVKSWAEDKTREIEQLKEQEAFRRQFIGNLAHELKTPVFSIQGYILTLLEGGLDDPEINRKFLEKASKGVDRMTHIIEDLDTITQFESGRLTLDIREIDLVQLSKDVMDPLEMKAQQKGVRLVFGDKYDKPVKVKGDKGRIEQVLTNLLTNSINYGQEGGKTEVRFFDMEENMLIEVADDGIGIPDEEVPRLFERFYRVDKSRSRNEGGTGLGLAIVKHIIDAHGQTINVRSTEGVGTTFSFTLKKA